MSGYQGEWIVGTQGEIRAETGSLIEVFRAAELADCEIVRKIECDSSARIDCEYNPGQLWSPPLV